MKTKYRFLTINAQQNPAVFMDCFETILGHGDQPIINLQPLDEEDEELINEFDEGQKNFED